LGAFRGFSIQRNGIGNTGLARVLSRQIYS
jgi:hypothetical protein